MVRLYVAAMVAAAAIHVALSSGGAGAATCAGCIGEACPTATGMCAPLIATVAGYAACVGAVCAFCAVACSVSALACYDQNTTVITPSGARAIAEIRPGDFLLGVGNSYSIVEDVNYVPGMFDMVTVTANGGEAFLKTTVDHLHFSVVNGSLAGIDANNLTPGHWMQGITGANLQITSMSRSLSIGKYYIATASCSIYANGLLSSSYCREFWVKYMGVPALKACPAKDPLNNNSVIEAGHDENPHNNAAVKAIKAV